jgi:glycosyltransferase involved in cell wall biosynthesis
MAQHFSSAEAPSFPPHPRATSLSTIDRQNPPRELPLYTRQLLRRIRLKLADAVPERLPLDFSVVICTYNGEHRLPDVLKGLMWQLRSQPLAWEVIVVDNNSTDGTAAVVESFRHQWPQGIPLRYAFEPQQGAGFARQHAIQIARSPLIGFLDDDNIPSMLWVPKAHQFAQLHPQAGTYGSRLHGEFEATPPPHFERIAALLALTERGSQPLIYHPKHKVLPPGAGLVVRRQAWQETVPETLSLAGKIGARAAGEDLEVVLYMQRQGWEVWYNPAMRVSHKIPAFRLQRDYLLRLCRGIGLSRHRTRMLSFPAWQRPFVTPLYMLNDGRKIVRHLLKYRQAAITDTVAACELTLYGYSLASPFYMGWRQLRQWQEQFQPAAQAGPSPTAPILQSSPQG